MGNVGSRIDDSGTLFFKDQSRCGYLHATLCCRFYITDFESTFSLVTIANITITNSRRRVLLTVTPNSFPATRYIAKRDTGDDSPVEYIQVRMDAVRSVD
jgi:Arf-GAP/SH3 domain/ANK repeat/PH domain-containing protein